MNEQLIRQLLKQIAPQVNKVSGHLHQTQEALGAEADEELQQHVEAIDDLAMDLATIDKIQLTPRTLKFLACKIFHFFAVSAAILDTAYPGRPDMKALADVIRAAGVALTQMLENAHI